MTSPEVSANLSFKDDQEQINATCIKLERTLIRDTKKWLDLLFLRKYVEYKIIPRGLRVQKNPSMDLSDDEFIMKWNSAQDDCSFNLIKLIMLQQEKHLNILDKEIEDLRLELGSLENIKD